MKFYKEIVKYIAEAEKVNNPEFDSWLKDSNNAEIVSQISKINEAVSDLNTHVTVDTASAWQNFQNNIEQKVEKKPKLRSIILKWSIAASIALICFTFFNRPKEVSYIATDSILNLDLPDSSKITLYPNSKIILDRDFEYGLERLLNLQGTAIFDIIRDESRPFIVSTETSVTKVLGTVFKISQLDSLESVEVIEGQVACTKTDDMGFQVILNKGDKAIITTNTLRKIDAVKPKVDTPKVKSKPKPKVELPVKKPIVPKKEVQKPEPRPIKKLSRYKVKNVVEYLKKNHPERKQFRKKGRWKIDDSYEIAIDLNTSLSEIITALEAEYKLEYTQDKCETCYELRSIKNK